MVDRREFRFEFPCPSCQARLRLKDRQLIGTQWNCPECQTRLVIVDAGAGNLTASLAPPSPSMVVSTERNTPAKRVSISVALTAIVVIVSAAVYLLGPSHPDPELPHSVPENKIATTIPVTPAVVAPVVPAEVDPSHDQLLSMGKWLRGYLDSTGAFPSAVMSSELDVADRLSWLASYRESTETTSTMHADPTHAWNGPANEAFVRRRALSLLNPNIAHLASDDGYPASHYVGVAGVGEDAPQLPKSNPRAGVFGNDRRTTHDDIQDGASNTLMVLGVDQHPPAWADGANSVRGLTAEPYVHGPDHFGTGQADGMHVLMADGSVRFLSSQTDPKLMRRMAAMADGLPLDPQVPGEPTDPPPSVPDPTVASSAPPVVHDSTPSAEPISVELASDPVGFDVERGLSVSLTRYQLARPIPLRQLLREIVEMSALPIDTSALQNDPRLDQPISLDLQNTTLKDVLLAALLQAKLQYTADKQGIHVTGVAPPATQSGSTLPESGAPTGADESPKKEVPADETPVASEPAP